MKFFKTIFILVIGILISSCQKNKYRYRITYPEKGILLEGRLVNNQIMYNKLFIWTGPTLPPDYKNIEKTLKYKNFHSHKINIKIGQRIFDINKIINNSYCSKFRINISIKRDSPEKGMTSFYFSPNLHGYILSGVIYKNEIIMLTYSVAHYRHDTDFSIIIDSKEVKLPIYKNKIIKIFGKMFNEERYKRE